MVNLPFSYPFVGVAEPITSHQPNFQRTHRVKPEKAIESPTGLNIHVSDSKWEVPVENPQTHGQNMQTPQRKGLRPCAKQSEFLILL